MLIEFWWSILARWSNNRRILILDSSSGAGKGCGSNIFGFEQPSSKSDYPWSHAGWLYLISRLTFEALHTLKDPINSTAELPESGLLSLWLQILQAALRYVAKHCSYTPRLSSHHGLTFIRQEGVGYGFSINYHSAGTSFRFFNGYDSKLGT